MRRDAFTTTPEAAAEFEAGQTPGYDERYDRYEPDRSPSRQDDTCERDDQIHELALRADRMLRGISWRRA